MKAFRNILLVEDSEADIELTMAALQENQLANEVIIARDGCEALDYLFRRGRFQDCADNQPLVVLLDLKMPKVDGMDVLRQMKRDPELKRIPVVMLTSSREEQDLLKSYDLGVNAYVVKPVDFPQFVEAVKRIGCFWAVINEPPPAGPQRGI